MQEKKNLTPTRLLLEAPDLGLSVTMVTRPDINPEICEAIMSTLPLKSLFGHVVVAGDGFWLPTRLVYLGASNMIKRSIGSVYYNAAGQSLCLTYGTITESAVVNEFARIEEDSLEDLTKLGRAVWRHTVESPVRKSVLGILSKVKG